MHIAFKFTYRHDNGLMDRLLPHIIAQVDTPLTLYRDGDTRVIEASGDQATLERVAETVSSRVPRSLFLTIHPVEAIESLHGAEPYETDRVAFHVPYCLECQDYVVETLDPFKPCPVCGSSDGHFEFDAAQHGDPRIFFTALATRLIKERRLTVQTYNGERTFSMDEQAGILVCNPEALAENFVITQGEIDAMTTVEKPEVRLKPKLRFRAEHESTPPFYQVFLPDDTITLALAQALREQGADLVFCDKPPTLRVAGLGDGHAIVSAGRDLLPWQCCFALKSAASCTFDGTAAYGDMQGLLVDQHVRTTERRIQYIAHDDPPDGALRFEPAHAALRSVVLEHTLDDKRLCGIYLSRRHASQIFGFSKKTGYTPVAVEAEMPAPGAMLDAIAAMNESGAKLIANFEQAHPDAVRKIREVRFKPDSNVSMMTTLWATAAVIMELYDGDDAGIACETLEAAAIEFTGKSGPRIDYKVVQSDRGYALDPRSTLRSTISFRLAGVDPYLLSYGFIDSLADFIIDHIELIHESLGIEGVVLTGDLFENRQLLGRTYQVVGSSHPVYRNERMPMDGPNVTIGALTLGSE